MIERPTCELCGDCDFYCPERRIDGKMERYGKCHRYPPKTSDGSKVENGVVFAEFPIVYDVNFCGEFRKITRSRLHQIYTREEFRA